MTVRISRLNNQAATFAKSNPPTRVYIVDARYICSDPPIFSSTAKKADASLFDEDDATRLIGSHWRGLDPRIER